MQRRILCAKRVKVSGEWEERQHMSSFINGPVQKNIVKVISSGGKQAGYIAVKSFKNVIGKTDGTIVQLKVYRLA